MTRIAIIACAAALLLGCEVPFHEDVAQCCAELSDGGACIDGREVFYTALEGHGVDVWADEETACTRKGFVPKPGED